MTLSWETDMFSRRPFTAIPPDTIKKAKTIMGRDNFYLKVGDNWEYLLAETQSFSIEKKEASQHWMIPTLIIGTLLQHKESLSDRQTEEASRLRVDWKYALHLSMYYPGLTRAMLCKYRQRVYHNRIWQQELQSVLERFVERGFYQGNEHPPLTATGLLDEVCNQSRLEEIVLAQRRALEALATNYPKWLRDIILPHWYARYHLFKATPELPQSAAAQGVLAEAIGADILYLFEALARSDQPEPGELEEIKALHQTWLEQFELAGDGKARCLARCTFCGSLKTSREI